MLKFAYTPEEEKAVAAMRQELDTAKKGSEGFFKSTAGLVVVGAGAAALAAGATYFFTRDSGEEPAKK